MAGLRLIDLCAFPESLDAALVTEVSDDVRYVTLSYCWGQKTKDQYRTTKETIKDRKRGIAHDDLPKTFQDAFKICRELGERYIWIDAVCIIQDDKADWKAQAAQMGSVYANTQFTIATDTSAGPNAGCFNKPQENGNGICRPWCRITSTLHDGSPSTLYFHRKPRLQFPHNHPWPVDRGVLNTRGWTLQERILSPRILHYNNEQLFWECREGFQAEDALSQWYNDFGPGLTMPSTVVERISSQAADESSEPPRPEQSTLVQWYSKIATEYSKRHLTYNTDKYIAIAGLAQCFSPRLQSPYVAGIWLQNLGFGLSWRRGDTANIERDPQKWATKTRLPKIENMPSFSWVCSEDPVYWGSRYGSPIHEEWVKNMVNLPEDSILEKSGNFIDFNDVHLTVSCLLKEGKCIKGNDGRCVLIDESDIAEDGRKLLLGSIDEIDVDEIDDVDGLNVLCLPLYEDRGLCALLVKPVLGVKSTYTRIGLLHIHASEHRWPSTIKKPEGSMGFTFRPDGRDGATQAAIYGKWHKEGVDPRSPWFDDCVSQIITLV